VSGFGDEPPTPCPKCGDKSPCVDFCEVDIGVGVQRWNHEYRCPTHGDFAFVQVAGTYRSQPIFRDDEPPDAGRKEE
jgi:hypothetical protein